jgi:hypothetical protein
MWFVSSVERIRRKLTNFYLKIFIDQRPTEVSEKFSDSCNIREKGQTDRPLVLAGEDEHEERLRWERTHRLV